MRIGHVGVLAAGLLTAAVPASAQMVRTPIEAPADQPYRFRHSGLTIPPILDGMPRKAIEQYRTDELDVFANYERESDAITVYVYRKASGAVPVWFDRARTSIEARRDVYGTVTPAIASTPFTPPGQRVASGLMGAWSITKPPYRGTALALLPMGEWLVKVRYSSATLDGAGVAARMPTVLAALTWPTGLAPAPAAQPVADCATPLAYPRKAKVIRDQKSLSSMAVAGGLLATLMAKAKPAEPEKAAVWCRDPGASPIGAVYRADASTDGYLLAFSDAGRGAMVAPDAIGAMIDKNAKQRWSVALIDLGETSSFPPLTALPEPDQVIALIQQPALSRTNTWGEKSEVTVNAGALGGKR